MRDRQTDKQTDRQTVGGGRIQLKNLEAKKV